MKFFVAIVAVLMILVVGFFALNSYIYNEKQADETVNEQIVTPASLPDLIVVESPLPNQTITNPVVVRGTARGYWFFEASAPVSVVDWDGRIIGEGYITADGEWMTEDFVPFTGTISYDLPADTYSTRGAIIFQKDNPSGLPENDRALEIPVELTI